MYTKKQVDEMLSQVEHEFSNTLETIQKNESVEIEEIETEAVEIEELDKSEEESEDAYEPTMDDLYTSMDKSEQEAHYASVKKALFSESMEKDEDEDLSPHAKEQKAKSDQKKLVSENSAAGKIDRGYDKSAHHDDQAKMKRKMGKSEEDLMTEVEELKKSVETYEGLFDKMLKTSNAPKAKALTGYDVIAKSEGTEGQEESKIDKMSKSEITSKLNRINYETLTKSDRSAINEYCLENASVDKIKHLIKE